MKFLYQDLGHRRAGEIVEICLQGSAANVRLMDASNFANYRHGRSYEYWGGHVTRSPYYTEVPRSGRWYMVIDLGGYAGSVRADVQVLPGRLAVA